MGWVAEVEAVINGELEDVYRDLKQLMEVLLVVLEWSPGLQQALREGEHEGPVSGKRRLVPQEDAEFFAHFVEQVQLVVFGMAKD